MKEITNNSYNYFLYNPDCQYPSAPPYDPEQNYPEYPFEFRENIEKNDVYRMIREIFANSNMDSKNYNLPAWNPLGEYIKPGNIVLIKPNLVMHSNPIGRDRQKGLDCLITHPSVVRCLFDYVYIALKGEGKIIIADAPVQDCKFDILLKKSGYSKLFQELLNKNSNKILIDIQDLRDTELCYENGKQRQIGIKNKKYNGIIVNLENNSRFKDCEETKKYRITNYASSDTVFHHSKGRNEYCISEALLGADVVINIPKPKTHRIAGYTAALKNMIGVSTRKEYLPHYRKGYKGVLGDEYLETHKILKWFNSTGNDIKNIGLKYQIDLLTDSFNKFCRYTGKKLDMLEKNRKKFGMWYGNDTIWRTILDVNSIVYFFDKNGRKCKEKQRIVLHFGDMIVCGEKEGPLKPTYKKICGILFSNNPVSFDCCVVKLMGFDYKKLPVLKHALTEKELIIERVDEIKLYSNEKEFNKKIVDINKNFKFIPSSGWENYL